MKIKPEAILSAYFHSWWMPGVICLGMIVVSTAAAVAYWPPFAILINALFLGAGLAFLWIVFVAMCHLYMERLLKGLFQFVMLAICGAAMFIGFTFLTFGPTRDPFADNLTIPDDIVVSEPKAELDAGPGSEKDGFQARLLDALAVPGGDDPSVTADVASLARLGRENPDVLWRHLATSPAWRVFEERGDRFATRRWMIGSRWQYTLHGYYRSYDIYTGSIPGVAYFQTRLTIGLSGKPWMRENEDTIRLRAGETSTAIPASDDSLHQSSVLITAGGLVVEVFEQSEGKERRLTKAALAHLEEEFRPLAETPDVATIRARLPASSTRRGEPSLDLRESSHSGIYTSEIWLNPGEPGMIYHRAFEVTKGTPLSAERLKRASNEWVGWSDDPDELFFSNTHFTIYEGDSGDPYAARFEVWFVPDTGAPERNLLEKTFKIEGWQR